MSWFISIYLIVNTTVVSYLVALIIHYAVDRNKYRWWCAACQMMRWW